MRTALVLLALAGAGWWAVGQPRRTSRRRLVRRVYRHVDEILGARRFELDRRVARRRLLAFFSHDLANLVYPTVQYGGSAALPSTRRMGRYVQLDLAPVAWPKKVRTWHVRAVTLRWTSEANALGEGFSTLLARKMAQALLLDGAGKLEASPAWDQGRITLTRTRPARPIPERVPFEGEVASE